jgi:hypothetical protein
VRQKLGSDHPKVRAFFGRYVAAREVGIITEQSAGPEAYRAFRRRTGDPGYLNRSQRRHRT